MCCRSGPVIAAVVARRCNLNNDTFHFYVDELTCKGYLSRTWLGDQAVYSTAPLGVAVLRKFGELQVLVAPLERSFGKLLV